MNRHLHSGDEGGREIATAPVDLIPDTEPGEPVMEARPPSRRRLALSTVFFSVATGLSRVAGLVREIFAASYFGVTGQMSAFTIAFQVPNLIRSLFADAALQGAFVPVFTEQLERGNRREAYRIGSILFYAILLVLGGLTAIFILTAPWVMPLFAPGLDGPLKVLTASLAQLLFPIVLLLGVSGLTVGILNSFHHFSVPAISPVFWNLAIIAAMVVLVPKFSPADRIYAYAIGVLIGTTVQLVLPLPWLLKSGFRLEWSFNFRDSRVVEVFKLMIPVTLGLGLINFNLSVDSIFATLVSPEAPAAIDKAFRIYMLPQGMFSVAVATVLFPTLSRLAARRDRKGMVGELAVGNRRIALLLIPAAASILVLAEPITRVLYQRGEFGPDQTVLVASALWYFALSLPFAGANLMLTRTFFSLKSPLIPTVVALVNLFVNAGLDALLYRPLGIAGIPLSTAIVSAITTVALAVLLRRRLGGIDDGRTVKAIVKIVVASTALAAVLWFAWEVLEDAFGVGLWASVAALGLSCSAGILVYVAVTWVMGVPEVRSLGRFARRRIGR